MSPMYMFFVMIESAARDVGPHGTAANCSAADVTSRALDLRGVTPPMRSFHTPQNVT